MGGFKVLVVRRADMAAAYADDMFNWSLMISGTAEDGPRRQQYSGKKLQEKCTCILSKIAENHAHTSESRVHWMFVSGSLFSH